MSQAEKPLSVSNKRWVFRQYEERQAMAISQAYQLPDVIARLLAGRDIAHDHVMDFLNPTLKQSLPDPSHLIDMDKAVDRVVQAIQQDEKIAVFGDYDVDGATSSATLAKFFRMVGRDLRIYIPDRIEEGYGPNAAAFQQLKDEGISVVITVDCGTTAHEPLTAAADMGLDVIVLDHHDCEPKLPPCHALVNPKRLDESSSCTYLAAVGLCFLFIVALNRALRQKGWYKDRREPDVRSLLDLVALGTVCDVMPLEALNRTYVTQGLKVMGQRQNVGLKALADVAGINERPSVYHLGYILGPRINAGGRVGEASLGATLLSTDSAIEAHPIAQRLQQYNDERKEIEQACLEEAMSMAQSQEGPMILVAGEGWHPGVIGIVAGRLKEHFHRPTCVVSIDENGIGKGSGRSVSGIDLGALMHAAKQSGLLEAGGGHAMAAGFTVKKEKIAEFHAFLNGRIDAVPLPEVTLDGALQLQAVTEDFVETLERVGPFGVGNPTPRFLFQHLQVVRADIVGESHVRCILRDQQGTSIKSICFRAVDTSLGDLLLNSRGQPLHLVATLKTNNWMGRTTVDLTIDDAMLAAEDMKLVG
ncbi:MAG: single-stranded-DNA-specific exonuclease RecJ [Alphaproteobacteria bacterium]